MKVIDRLKQRIANTIANKNLEGNNISFEMKKEGKTITADAMILDCMILFKFSEKGIAKQVYDYESAHNKKLKTRFFEEQECYVEFYPGKTKEMLTEYLKQKLIKEGGKAK